MSSSISDWIKTYAAPYLLIGGIGGGVALAILYLIGLISGTNPLFADFLFWDVMLLSFVVFLAALNYHIKNKFSGYQIPQTLLLNAVSSLLGILIFTTFLGFVIPLSPANMEEYKSSAVEEVMENKEAFSERGVSDEDYLEYIDAIKAKDARSLALDTFQKLLLASPFVVFVAFVLILLMHFMIIVSRERQLKKIQKNGK